MTTPGTNTGHGHVWPRPDRVRMRCGGPRMCSQCAHDAAQRDALHAAERAVIDAALAQYHGDIDPDSAAALDAACEQLVNIRATTEETTR